MTSHYDYRAAVSRNIGWVTEDEQVRLRGCRVAIAGLGGVGGSHLLTLARLGIGAFTLAELDQFECANFNRQAGATCSSIGRSKLETLVAMALDINPDLRLRTFPEGVTDSTLEAFLEGVDLYVDGLDFFALKIRRQVFARCRERGIPAITAAPLGMGVAQLNFLPEQGMSFEDYFALEGCPEQEQLMRFMLGLSPALLQRHYLVDPSRVDFQAHKGPSTPMACALCSGVASTEALKILLGRGPVRAAPHGMHFDAYRLRYRHTWRPGGNRNPLQMLMLAVAKRQMSKGRSEVAPWLEPQALTDRPLIENVLNLARWAPSGDNTQIWRFEIVSDEQVVIHAHDTRDEVLYDVEGRASQLAVGALLESIRIAASHFNCDIGYQRRMDLPDTQPMIDVSLQPAGADAVPDPLVPYLRTRSTQRRLMRRRVLTDPEKAMLEQSLGPGMEVVWLEGRAKRLSSWLLYRLADARLRMPEAFKVHSQVIEWHARYSEDRIPAQAVGLNPLMTRLLPQFMTDWERVKFLNQWLLGAWLPRVELDLLPALFSGAHFLLRSSMPLTSLDATFEAGKALQRFWLTATRLNLQLQPTYSPIAFKQHHDAGKAISATPGLDETIKTLLDRFEALYGTDAWREGFFMGRIGAGVAPGSRSVRLPLERLLIGASRSQ